MRNFTVCKLLLFFLPFAAAPSIRRLTRISIILSAVYRATNRLSYYTCLVRSVEFLNVEKTCGDAGVDVCAF